MMTFSNSCTVALDWSNTRSETEGEELRTRGADIRDVLMKYSWRLTLRRRCPPV